MITCLSYVWPTICLKIQSSCSTDLVKHSSLPLCCKYFTTWLYIVWLLSLFVGHWLFELWNTACFLCLNRFLRFILILSFYVLFLFLNVFDNTFVLTYLLLTYLLSYEMRSFYLSVHFFPYRDENSLQNIIVMNNCFWHLSSWVCLFEF